MSSRLNFLFIFLISISNQALLANKQKVDSLENVLSHYSLNNTKKVDLMNEIAYSIFSNNEQEALRYANESARLSDSLKYDKGKAVSLWVTGKQAY